MKKLLLLSLRFTFVFCDISHVQAEEFYYKEVIKHLRIQHLLKLQKTKLLCQWLYHFRFCHSNWYIHL